MRDEAERKKWLSRAKDEVDCETLQRKMQEGERVSD